MTHMEKRTLAIALMLLCTIFVKAQSGYPITPVSFTCVDVTPETFWGQRLQASREVTIPLAFAKCEETDRYRNFKNAAAHMADSTKVFEVGGFPFDDTDPYKVLEGASYLMQTYPGTMIGGVPIDVYCDSVIAIIATAQLPDGYLYTARTQNPGHPHSWSGSKRYELVEENSHEFYNLGHLCEAAYAHYNATGKTSLLDIARKYADCICREIGPGEGQVTVVPGHEIAEMGLAKLYLVTGDKKYLDQAKYFLDQRGKVYPNLVRKDGRQFDSLGYHHANNIYTQSHKPVWEQDAAVGHAVRAGYLYAGMADVAALTGEQGYIDAIDRIWENIVSKKYYITGGVGALHQGEAFGVDYQLPNMSAYCETCAQIANVYMNYRLFLLHGDSKYYDVLERTLYNGVLSGISIDGGRFYYPNPLQSTGQHERQPWFGCACCPSNVARFVPSLPQYMYALDGTRLYVNLYAGNRLTTEINGRQTVICQKTDYPWNGDIKIEIEKSSGEFALCLRIPGWVRGEVVPSDLYAFTDDHVLGYSVSVNGVPQDVSHLDKGYCVIDRKWKKGDIVSVHFDMKPRTVRANEKVLDDHGRISVERGPLVYCAEWPDNSFDIMSSLMYNKPVFSEGSTKIAGTDIMTLTTSVQSLSIDKEGKLSVNDKPLTLIPYYAWAHRGKGNMMVWLPADVSAVVPER